MSELTAQQEREYVEAAWEWSVFWKPCPEADDLPWIMQVADADVEDIHEFTGATEDECVHAAYLFTLARLEEIRQLERDIDRIENYFWSASNWKDNLDDLEEQGQVVDAVRQQCADVRIVARLQAALAELKRGMTAGG
jgi:hypothetical protein